MIFKWCKYTLIETETRQKSDGLETQKSSDISNTVESDQSNDFKLQITILNSKFE